MRRFWLFFAIIIFIAVQLPYIYADDDLIKRLGEPLPKRQSLLEKQLLDKQQSLLEKQLRGEHQAWLKKQPLAIQPSIQENPFFVEQPSLAEKQPLAGDSTSQFYRLLQESKLMIASDEKETELYDKLEIVSTWVVGDTNILADLIADMDNLPISPKDVFPLPWQEYTEGENKNICFGAILTDGRKSYHVIHPAGLSPQHLDGSETTKVQAAFVFHPLKKLCFSDCYWPHILSEDDSVYFVSQEMLHDSKWSAVKDELHEKWQKLEKQCDIGLAINSSSDDGVIYGLRIGNMENGHKGFSAFMKIFAPENTPRGKSHAAHLDCDVPFRAGGFLGGQSPIKLSYRILPEDFGLAVYKIYISNNVKPQHLREKRSELYDLSMAFRTVSQEHGKYPYAAVVKGDFEFGHKWQPYLPSEEGVPNAKEIDAANRAFLRSLKPLIDEFAQKFARGAVKGPIDMAAKIEDDIFLFAIACEPGENDATIDWNHLDKINLTMFNFPNPYAEKPERKLEWKVAVSETETWQDITFSNVDCSLNGFGMRFVLGQGNGILCGAVDLELFRKLYDVHNTEKLSLSEKFELLKTLSPQYQARRSLAALKKSIEESQRISEEDSLLTVPSVLAVDMDEYNIVISQEIEKTQNQYVSTHQITMVDMSPQAVLAYTAQIFGGMVDSLPGMAQ